jgi:acyl-CoA synthetase (AMP-forming)/AMP-acid ligase II/acyl carrier protein
MAAEVREQIRRLVFEASDGRAQITDPRDTSEPLAGLDSLGLVALVVRIEKQFGISIPAEAMTATAFSSLESISSLVTAASGLEPGVHDVVASGRLQPPSPGTLLDSLRTWAGRQPNAPFLTWIPASGTAEVLTYGELDARSRDLAAWLRSSLDGDAGARAGAAPGTGLLAANDISTVVALFAIIRTGGPCLFINPGDPADRIRAILAAHPVSVVLRSPHVEGLDGIGTVVPGPAAARNGYQAVLPEPAPADSIFIFGTSGSTAASKFVIQSHRAALSNAQDLRRHHALSPGVSVAGGLPLHHVNGVHFTVAAVLEAGAHVIIPQRFSPLTYLSHLDEHRPAIASVVPSVLEALLVTGRGWRPPDSFRYFVSAAAPLSAALATRVMEVFGRRVVQGYGLTETTNFSTMLPVDLTDDEYAAVMLRASIPTVGVALPGNEVEVLSRDGQLLGEGMTGEVCMRGHNVMEGYLGAPELTAEAFAGGWYHSGDLGWWHWGPRGQQYFVLTGRTKNVAKVGGESVSLEEVERALTSLDEVEDAGCVALPHDLWGEQLVAIVALSGRASLEEVRVRLALLVPRAAVPQRWLAVESVPRSATGKIRRGELRELVTGVGRVVMDLP